MDHKEFESYLDHERECMVCGNDKTDTFEFWANEGPFKSVKCPDCGYIFLNPSVNQKGLEYYYSDYIGRRFEDPKKMQDRKSQYKIDADFLTNFIDEGSVLDVGCNGGFFLDQLPSSFQKFGLEIDSKAVEFAAREYPDFDIRAELLGEDQFAPGSFDVVMFRGVIEHMIDPRAALQRAEELLTPRGFVYFCATPNADSFSADFYREKWTLWHPVQHINIFSVETLHRLLGKDGFDLVSADYPYLGTPYADQAKDYQRIVEDIKLKEAGKWDKVVKSGPFWGNMLNAIYRKLR